MAVSNSIFSNSQRDVKTIITSHLSSLDSAVMNPEEERIFSTYKYWEPFQVPMQPIIEKDGLSNISAQGTKSLFNQYNAVFTYAPLREDANMPLLDSPESRKNIRNLTACTIKDLVDASADGRLGRQIYNYSDFAYCKHLGKISNNYLITLRRFATPCGDKIDKRNYVESESKLQNHLPDIGRLVTWIGTPGNEMSNILKYSFGQQWEDITADIQEVEIQSDKQQTPLAQIFNMSNTTYRQQVMQGMAPVGIPAKLPMAQMLGVSSDAFYDINSFQRMSADSTRVYGPIDVIDTTKKRKRGLKFEQKITLIFEYELRSYYGVNGKAAMIDLLGNILSTTYSLGTFWGGERRFVGAAQSNIFNNLPIFKLADKGGLNNPSAVYDAFIESVHQGTKAFSNSVKGDTTIEKIKNLAKDIGGMLLGGLLNKLGRPAKYAVNSLLSGAPVGCWHLTVGNPMSPIIEVGNLVCTNTEIEHFGPLGMDNFPTGLRVKIDLEHGKPRDIMGIEQMYGRGDTRFYAPMGDEIMNMYKKAEPIRKSNSKAAQSAKKEKEEKEQFADVATQDIAIALNTENFDRSTLTVAADKIANDELHNLKRYFGMTDQNMIITASAESLYGAEKRKNLHSASDKSSKKVPKS